MKPHLIVRLRSDRRPSVAAVPFWKTFVQDKGLVVESFHPVFDREFASFDLPFWVTSEYEAAAGEWSQEEKAAGLNRIYRIIFQRNSELPPALVERVRLISDFEYVRPILVGSSPIPKLSRQAALPPAFDRSREMIGLREAQLFGDGDPRIRVAILDTGIDLSHLEIRGRVVERADFVHLEGLDTTEFIGDVTDYDEEPLDEVGHGTHVAGIVAGEGVAMPRGVAPKCSLMAVRTLATMRTPHGVEGAGLVDNINVAIKWSVDHGAHVINCSLGIRQAGGGLPHEEVIRYALARGVTFVAASGNDGTDQKYYPGALPGVIAVGAAGPDGDVASFSSYGAPVWLIAPGTDVFSSYAQGRYERASGTSQASPFVAGAVALLKSNALKHGVQLGDTDVKAILRHTSDRAGREQRTARSGYGRLNVLDACGLLNHMLEDRGLRGSRLINNRGA